MAAGIGIALLANPATGHAETANSDPAGNSSSTHGRATASSARTAGRPTSAPSKTSTAPVRVKPVPTVDVRRSVQAAQRNWYQRTFEAVTPTFPPQIRSEALDPGETSDPFPLGGVDTDGRRLTYAVHGAGTNGGTLTVSGSQAAYTAPGDWNGTDPYTDTFQVTTSDFWSGPHIHGLAGLVNLLTFGLVGSSGHNASGTVTVSVAPYNAGTFPVDFVNNSSYDSGQIYVTVLGQTSKDHWAWVDQNGTTHAINHDDADAPGHLVKDGVNYANMSYTLGQAANLRMPPDLQGARIYVSVAQPLYIGISQDNSGWTVPDPVGVTNPNYGTVYDWFEFTFQYGGVPFGGNTTQVDQFGLPLSFTLAQGSFSDTRGTTATRNQVFTTYQNSVPTEFQQLVINDGHGNPLRIASPRSVQPGALAQYLDEPVNDFWTKYKTEPFTFTSPGSYTVTGQVDANNQFAYTVIALNPAGVSGSYLMDKPTTAQVFAGDGPFVGTHEQGAFLAQLDAAFNRGVAASPDKWGDVAAYYPAGTKYNSYAKVFHQLGLDGKNYGFPYDDVNGQSSVLILNNSLPPNVVTITIN
ncbi:glycoside hydrolase family 64 protein [Mycolicibacterium psychrotolerans]|uniref:glycoside hydrolase family 64 protein n=1 Tax=Mycolicibacterium psychrotolerans TaxID=216929 RepID=UPI003D67F35C